MFDDNKPIRRVQASDTGVNFIYGVKFLDNQVSIYDPKNGFKNYPGTVSHLEDNEDLIGVYGVKDKEKWFTAFGFILKVKEE